MISLSHTPVAWAASRIACRGLLPIAIFLLPIVAEADATPPPAVAAPTITGGKLSSLGSQGKAGQTTPPATPPAIPPIPATAPSVIVSPTSGQLPGDIEIPPPVNRPPFLPFPNLPTVPLDENNDGIGIAQSLTRTRGLQARIIWIDATANIDRYNTAAKIAALVAQIKATGFNTIVFDVKPIIGFTVYPSRFAPKLTEWVRPWGTKTLPQNFDPLQEMVAQAHAQNLSLIANFNVFSEGHRDFQKGPGYDHPEWQTILYDIQTRVRRDLVGTPGYNLTDKPNTAPRLPDDLSLYNDLSRIPAAGDPTVSVIDATGTVLLQTTGVALKTLHLTLPRGGAALVGTSPLSSNFLHFNALPGYRLVMDSIPVYVPIGQRPDSQVPLMTNPNDPAVRQRLLDMLTELTTNYAVDGVIFDDRLRYASLNADFSTTTQQQFEAYVGGKTLHWPDDVFRYNVDFPALDRTVVPGPYFDSWLVFRALTIRNWLADAVRTIKTARPLAVVGTYVGSWYPDYPDIGANWGADDLDAGFHFLNDSYRKTGWAGIVDFVITGCYYSTASIYEAQTQGISVGESVEAAGQFSNRAVNDQSFVYAGIGLDEFKDRPDALRRVLQAACATTQGVMCFDLSHDIEPLWPIFSEAFRQPTLAPHQVAGLVAQVRLQHASQKSTGIPTPAVILYRGASGTGF